MSLITLESDRNFSTFRESKPFMGNCALAILIQNLLILDLLYLVLYPHPGLKLSRMLTEQDLETLLF